MPAVTRHSPTPAEWGLAATLFAAGYAWLFRAFVFTGFDGTFGDLGDGRIVIAILEHWHDVFTGKAAGWRDPAFFYPAKGTLGLTDAYFLYALPYAAARALGADPYLATMAALSLVVALGYGAMLRLGHGLGLPLAAAAIAAFLACFANMVAVKLVHVQSFAALLLPVVGVLVAAALAARARLPQLALGAAAGGLVGLVFLTAFQTAWFFGLLVVLTNLMLPVAFGLRGALALVHGFLTRHALVAIGLAIGFGCGIAPFLALYLPVLAAGRARDFAEVVSNAPLLADLLNVTPDNLVWGRVLASAGIAVTENRPHWEVELGFTPVALAAAIAGLGVLAARRWQGTATRPQALLLALGLGATLLVGLQFPWGGFRPWAVIYDLVPGATAVRYPFRAQIVVNLVAGLLAAAALSALWQSRPRRGWLAALALLVIIEQANSAYPVTLSRHADTAMLARLEPPPAGCRAFYLVPRPGPSGLPYWEQQAGAMVIAGVIGLPTLNGFSSFLPEGFGTLEFPDDPAYPEALHAWATRHGLAPATLCGLDPATGRFTQGLP